MMLLKRGVCVWLVCCIASAATADTMDAPRGEFVPFTMDSARLTNGGPEAVTGETNTVSVDGAMWLRLYFEEVALGEGSFLRMTSHLDGEVQELDAAGLAMWSNTSAYFNGDAVSVELVAAPGTVDNYFRIRQIAIELDPQEAGSCGICGADDRVPSSEDWSGRVFPSGCTGSIYNEQGCIVTAGHCVSGGGAQVIQFRVPPSLPNCNTVNPPVADQFPVTASQSQNAGVGLDWGVLTTGTNNLGETCFQRYGALRRISTQLWDTGDRAAIWGYGADSECVRNYVQQYHEDSVIGRFTNHYEYDTDMTFGNSGSGVIDSNNEIFAINTHCQQAGCRNYGTRVDKADFAAARENLCAEVQVIPCEDVRRFQARCTGQGRLQMRVVMTDNSHDGETVTFDVDGTNYVRTINGDRTTLSIGHQGGTGQRTITLEDPSGCFNPITVTCN